MSSSVDLTPQTALDGLPKAFVESLRTLFDILDESRTGSVSLRDIEARWSENAKGLPPGVLDALKKVTPPNGRLSFERFVGGLRIALVRARSETPSARTSVVSRNSRTTLQSVESQLRAGSKVDSTDGKVGFVQFDDRNLRSHAQPHQRARSAPSSKPSAPPTHPASRIEGNGNVTNGVVNAANSGVNAANDGVITANGGVNGANGAFYSMNGQPQKPSGISLGNLRQPSPHRHAPQHAAQTPQTAAPLAFPFDQPPGRHAHLKPEMTRAQFVQPREGHLAPPDNLPRKRHSVSGSAQHFPAPTNSSRANFLPQFSPRAAALVHPMPSAGQVTGDDGRPRFTTSKSAPNLKQTLNQENSDGRNSLTRNVARQSYRTNGNLNDAMSGLKITAGVSDGQPSPGSDDVFRSQAPNYPSQYGKRLSTAGSGTAFARVTPRVASYPQEIIYANPRSMESNVPDSTEATIYGPSGSIGSRKSEVMDVLKSWQQNALVNEWNAKKNGSVPENQMLPNATSQAATTYSRQNEAATSTGTWGRDRRERRKDTRRHTLNNGVDYNMIKRLKQVEQERDLLLQGLTVLDKAREWYQQQLRIVAEKHQQVTKNLITEYSFEGQQEQLMFQMARIAEVNQQLEGLIHCKDKAFLDSMNLAVSSARPSDESSIPGVVVHRLKKQNDDLFKDLDQKSRRITQLESEKASLIRELFEARSKTQHSKYNLSTTFHSHSADGHETDTTFT